MTRRLSSRRLVPGSGEAESDAAFIAEFGRIRDEVLRPVMDEVGAQLRVDGYDFEVTSRGAEASPIVDFHVVIPGRGESKDTIRFFAHKDALRGWQVVAEIELKRSPMELARFDAGDPITRDVAEQLLVDATEQMFASALAAPRSEEPSPSAALAPASPRRPVAAEAVSADAALPSARDDAATGARAHVIKRLRTGRLLHGLNLVGADLHGLDFSGAVMPGLDLRDAKLRGSKLIGARLTAARLCGADLTEADLTGADLSRADLSRAVLTGARLDGATLVDAIGVSLASPDAAIDPEAPATEVMPERGGAKPLSPDVSAPAPAEALEARPAAPETRPARLVGEQEVSETAEVNVAAVYAAALPFSNGPPAPEFFAAVAASRAREPERDAGETVAVPALTVPAPAESSAAVLGQPHTPSLAALTVEQYAAFCAEHATFPERSAEIDRCYGMNTTEEGTALRDAWTRRFQADATVERRWQALVAHYSDWYRRRSAR